MRNQSSQPLGGQIQISPLATPTSQFSRRGAGASAAGSPGERVLLDFAGLSATAQRALDTFKGQQDSEFSQLGTQVGKLREQGKTDEEILKEISADGSSPRRVASRLAKLYNQEDGFSRANNPVFKLALQSVRGEARAQEAGRTAATLRAAAVQRVAQGKPEDRERLIAEELGNLRKETAEILDPESLGYFGIQAAEAHLKQINAQYANDLSTGAAAVQLAEAQLEVRNQYLAETAKVVEAYQKNTNPYAATEEAVKAFGAIGEQAKFAGIVTSTELKQYALSAAGEIKIGVSNKAAADFLEYSLDNLRDGNGKAYLDGDTALQGALDNYRFKASKEAQDLYFEAQRNRESQQFALNESPIGIELSGHIRDQSPSVLLEKIDNARSILATGTPEAISEALGIEFDPGLRGNALAWLDKFAFNATRTQSSYQGIELEVLEGELFDQFVEDPQGAFRTLESADISGKQYFSIREKLNAFRDNGASEAYAKLTQSKRLESAVAEAVLRTVPRNFDEDPLDTVLYQEIVREELARVRGSIATSPELAERIKNSSIEAANFLDETSKFIRTSRGEVQVLDTGTGVPQNQTDADTIGKTDGVGAEEVKTRRDRFQQQLSSRVDFRTGKAVIGGFDPATVPGRIKSIQDIATEGLQEQSLSRDLRGLNRGQELIRTIGHYTRIQGSEEPEKGWRAISEAIALSGMVTSADLFQTSDEIYESLAGEPGKFGMPNDDLLDLSGFNIFSARLADTKDSYKWFKQDTHGNLLATKDFPQEMRSKIGLLLAKTGVEPSNYNILQFISYQAAEWGKDN